MIKKNDKPIEVRSASNQEETKKVNTLSKSAKSSMVTRILSAIGIVAVMVPAVFLGDWIYFGVMSILLGIACWEILGCIQKRTFVIFIIFDKCFNNIIFPFPSITVFISLIICFLTMNSD